MRNSFIKPEPPLVEEPVMRRWRRVSSWAVLLCVLLVIQFAIWVGHVVWLAERDVWRWL